MVPEAYCFIPEEDPWSALHPTAHGFLTRLALSPIHPHCNTPPMDGVPSMGPLNDYSHHRGTLDAIITGWYQAAPALLAMGELWLRLFAGFIGPLSAAYLVGEEIRVGSFVGKKPGIHDAGTVHHRRWNATASILGLASCLVLLTDSLYVYEYGRSYGAVLFGLVTILSVRSSIRHNRRFLFWCLVLPIITLAVLLLVNSDGVTLVNWGILPSFLRSPLPHPGLDLPTMPEGLYYSNSNEVMSQIAQNWPEQSRTYSVENGATPYLTTGDSRTGIPFLVNKDTVPVQEYVRVWMPTSDGEAVALDVAFPSEHSATKPVYLILHGLNGGSHEEYVMEFVMRRRREGYTCVVMVARGLMDLPLRGWDVFHGARVADVDESAKALRRALGPKQLLAGVGYSMGAIVLSNYVARSGANCHLHAAMAVSGGLDMREQHNFYRSMRLWQPMLAQTLRDDFIVGKFAGRYKKRLTDVQFLNLMRASHITSIDLHAVVTYNGFDDLPHYYSEMSAMGDLTKFSSNATRASDGGLLDQFTDSDLSHSRISNVSVPFCALHGLDDPLVTWRTMGRGVDPNSLVNSGSGHVMLLLTKAGGHVGWPLGLNPQAEGWRWMNDAVRDFVDSVDKVLMRRE